MQKNIILVVWIKNICIDAILQSLRLLQNLDMNMLNNIQIMPIISMLIYFRGGVWISNLFQTVVINYPITGSPPQCSVLPCFSIPPTIRSNWRVSCTGCTKYYSSATPQPHRKSILPKQNSPT